MAALIFRSPQVASGVIYIGDSCLDAGREHHVCGSCRKAGKIECGHEHCCMARLMRRCGRTAHRAKYDLADAGLVRLHGAGRRMCPCGRCGGTSAGGSILDQTGKPVGAATGYELDPEVFAVPVERPRPTGAAPPAATVQQRLTLAAGQRQLADALERMRQRAGP